MQDATPALKDRLLDAALTHVAFDGWSQATFRAAVSDTGVDMSAAKLCCPRGAVDLAVAYHERGDARMIERLEATDLSQMRFRDRIATAIRFRLEASGDAEAVRRGTTLFALPMHAAEGTRLIWGTADAIWTALGDTSEDVNWYTKRATLSAVYGSVLLFWLGDDSADKQDTWAFLDRRIDDVMQIEKLKGQVRESPVLSGLLAGPNWLLGQVRAPARMPRVDLPGHWSPGPGDEA